MSNHYSEEEIKQNAEKALKAAKNILVHSRNMLRLDYRFLDLALAMLSDVPIEPDYYATDGVWFGFNVRKTIEDYQQTLGNDMSGGSQISTKVTRSYLHTVLHCVFRHPYVIPQLERDYWDLACDMAVEYMIDGMLTERVTTGLESAQEKIFDELKAEGVKISAEQIYRHFVKKNLGKPDIARLRGAFYADNHEPWYMTDEQKQTIGFPAPGGKNMLKKEDWENVSGRMQMELEGFGKLPGNKAGHLVDDLRSVNRERYDYTSFLKSFAVTNEVMKINPDEFDYIYYTYGMEHYNRMPFIEPLEYKDEKRIRDFVIALDTSGSTASLVRSFMQKTYNILKSTESFTNKVNLHIVQCDTMIQEHKKLTAIPEIDDYIKNMKIRGFGGTDFRPVFEMVNKMIEDGELTNFKGLIFFTDGWGPFPDIKPDYQTAFVFVEDGDKDGSSFNNYDIPAWADKLILEKSEFED